MRPAPAHAPAPAPSRRRLAAAAVLAVAALTATAPGASAEDEPDGTIGVAAHSSAQCASGQFCLWAGASYSGAFWSTGTTGLVNTPVPVARSVWNRTSVDVRTYAGTGGTGTVTCWNAGAQAPVTAVGSASIRTMSPTTC